MFKYRFEKKHNYFMEVAKLTSQLSTCSSMSVGAIIVQDGHIVASGYNGVPSGMKHCEDTEMKREDHHEFANNYEIHAEMNALFDALDRGQKVRGATMYCTHSPCRNCYKHLKRAGIYMVHYNEKYHRVDEMELIEMQNSFPQGPMLNKFHNDEV